MLPPQWLGVYINADEIEKTVRANGCLNLAAFQVKTDNQEFHAFLQASGLLKKAGLLAQPSQFTLIDGSVVFGPVEVNSYWTSVLADFIRHKLLALKVSFTFETVMLRIPRHGGQHSMLIADT